MGLVLSIQRWMSSFLAAMSDADDENGTGSKLLTVFALEDSDTERSKSEFRGSTSKIVLKNCVFFCIKTGEVMWLLFYEIDLNNL